MSQEKAATLMCDITKKSINLKTESRLALSKHTIHEHVNITLIGAI